MPVLGQQPPVRPNQRGQMVSQGSGFNPRGIGTPRPPTSVMPSAAPQQRQPALANTAVAQAQGNNRPNNNRPRPNQRQRPNKKQRERPLVKQKGPLEGLNRREVKRVRNMRERLSSNKRRDPKGEVKGSRQLTGGERRKIKAKIKDFRRNPQSIGEFLAGDLTYKSQVSDLRRNKENYLSDFRANKEDVNETFSDTMAKMNREKKRQLESITEDFGGRGLLFSGLLPKTRQEYLTEFEHTGNELSDDRTEQKQDLRRNKQLFLEELRSVKRNARDDAIRRRAARFGL